MRLLIPIQCSRLVLLPLLAAIVSTALLSAGEARAVLANDTAACEALGEERFCVPGDTEMILDQTFVVGARTFDDD